MPKRVPEEELDAIVKVVAAYPHSVRVSAIRDQLPHEMPVRMLQRRLALLVKRKRLVAEGRAKGRRYRVPSHDAVTPSEKEIYPDLSSEAKAIRETVRAPIQQRTPVGYQRTFLDAYQPNIIHYLPAQVRQHLLEIGCLPGDDQPAGTFARTIYDRLLIDLSWNSSRLEGNTYSLLETERLIELGDAADGKDALEAQMILNHKAAIELLVGQADEIGFNRYTILNLHALLSDNLLADPQASGRLRNMPVGIKGTVYHPLEVPQLIEECFGSILDTAAAISDPFEQAFFALVHLAYLQGFQDVNKRVARLAVNIPLIHGNLCPLSFVDVPERAYLDGVLAVYELNRVELLRDLFVWAYERSSARYSAVRQSFGEPDPLRLRYRVLIDEIVSFVVRATLDKKAAIALVRQRAEAQVPSSHQARFVKIVETDLMHLHEGNIARFSVRPAEYRAWQQGWR
ncbi:MAG: Fic family protein [Gammaproteobacteria bacterium]|nr:Fic family protein [Gammaproteobacteria bacterium]